MSKREISLFERPAVICYCVAGGASSCAPCRERRALEPIIADPIPLEAVMDRPMQSFLDWVKFGPIAPPPSNSERLKLIRKALFDIHDKMIYPPRIVASKKPEWMA